MSAMVPAPYQDYKHHDWGFSTILLWELLFDYTLYRTTLLLTIKNIFLQIYETKLILSNNTVSAYSLNSECVPCFTFSLGIKHNVILKQQTLITEGIKREINEKTFI